MGHIIKTEEQRKETDGGPIVVKVTVMFLFLKYKSMLISLPYTHMTGLVRMGTLM